MLALEEMVPATPFSAAAGDAKQSRARAAAAPGVRDDRRMTGTTPIGESKAVPTAPLGGRVPAASLSFCEIPRANCRISSMFEGGGDSASTWVTIIGGYTTEWSRIENYIEQRVGAIVERVVSRSNFIHIKMSNTLQVESLMRLSRTQVDGDQLIVQRSHPEVIKADRYLLNIASEVPTLVAPGSGGETKEAQEATASLFSRLFSGMFSHWD